MVRGKDLLEVSQEYMKGQTLSCRGAGAAEMFGVSEEVDIHIGTLSKAVGAHGGFVACRTDLKSLLLNKGRPYIFSTALAVPVVAAALTAIRVNEQVRHTAWMMPDAWCSQVFRFQWHMA